MRYYHRFVKSYGSIAWPLKQLKKDSFAWTEEVEEAFIKLKNAMMTASFRIAHLYANRLW